MLYHVNIKLVLPKYLMFIYLLFHKIILIFWFLVFTQGRPIKRWVIVFFVESNLYSVVPLSWLDQSHLKEDLNASNISSVQYCQWPPYKVTSTELMAAIDPSNVWESYKIKIMDAKIYGIKIL